MAYDPTNPPFLVADGGVRAPRIWMLKGVDAMAVVDGAGYVTNAKAVGMSVDDLVFVLNSATHIWSSHSVMSIAANGSGNLSDGTVIGSAVNTD